MRRDTGAICHTAAGNGSDIFSTRATTGDMAWMADTAGSAGPHPTPLARGRHRPLSLPCPTHRTLIRWRALHEKSVGVISVYALNRDYHDIFKGKLKRLAHEFRQAASGADVKVFVDTAPVDGKAAWQQQAGLGWQGRHTNLVSREAGSWFFIGTILTDSRHCRMMRRKTIIAARAVPASTSARRRPFLRPTNSMRGAAFPISPSSTKATSRRNSASQWATAFMAAMIVWRCVRGTSSRWPAPRVKLKARDDLAVTAALETCFGWMTQHSGTRFPARR